MLIAGPSKAGKSFALIQLCIAIAEGKQWLGGRERKAYQKALYEDHRTAPSGETDVLKAEAAKKARKNSSYQNRRNNFNSFSFSICHYE